MKKYTNMILACVYNMMIYIILFSCSYLESKEDARTIVKRWLNQEITFPDSINTTSQDSLWQFMLKKEFKIQIYVLNVD